MNIIKKRKKVTVEVQVKMNKNILIKYTKE